jgi:uncharacterized protein YndB with AHSA1/START domain
MATNQMEIAADRSAVFAVLSNGWTYSNWVVGTSHMRAVEANWPATGTRLFHASGAWPLALRDETQVDECETDRRLVLTARGRPFGEARIEITLDDTDTGCRITLDETPVAGPGRWAHNPLSEAVLARRNEESLARLAAICEHRVAPLD